VESMRTYQYVTISYGNLNNSKLFVWATQPELIKWAESEVKRLFPKCKVEMQGLLQDQPQYLAFDRLDSRAWSVAWHLLRALCERGWEPLGSVESNGTTHDLRLGVDH